MNSLLDDTEAGDLLRSLPDLVLILARDGTVLGFCGGRSLSLLPPLTGYKGRRLGEVWPDALAKYLRQLAQRALTSREAADGRIQVASTRYEVRVTAQGPDRAMCVIRLPTSERTDGAQPYRHLGLQPPYLDPASFFIQLENSLALATLQERRVTLALVHVDGLVDISRLMDARIADRVLRTALHRFLAEGSNGPCLDCPWYISQLGDHLLALVIEAADRSIVETLAAELAASLVKPIELGDVAYHVKPSTGVAVSSQDGLTQEALMQQARAAVSEARRLETARLVFFTDTLELRSLARLDMARELREAIFQGDIRLRYSARHDLSTGQLSAFVGYLHWNHALRGEIRPATFLRLANATGLSTELSRSILASLREDLRRADAQFEPQIKVSFGPLRHHLLGDGFLDDIDALLASAPEAAQRLELRIAERAYLSGNPKRWQTLANLGLQLVIDEVARDFSSFNVLAHAPVWGLQLDRSWVTAAHEDVGAAKVCRAAIGVATAFDLIPIATGIDALPARDALRDWGCVHGMGDFFQVPTLWTSQFADDTASVARKASPTSVI